MNSNFYKIALSYEVSSNVLDSEEPNIVKARDILYENLGKIIPEKYDIFKSHLTIFQLKDSFNYIINFDAFIRSLGDLAMAEYVDASSVRDDVKNEIEEFFNTIDCEYKQLNIKPLL